MKGIIKNILVRFGYQIIKYPDKDLVRRIKIINLLKIDVLFDVGAHVGGYATKMRSIGYQNKIVSFEPIKNSFEALKKNSLKENNWIINNYALGNENTKNFINIAKNEVSSSILNINNEHIKGAPNSKYVGREEIEIKKMDSILNSFCSSEDNAMLKIDTQGYEKYVLEGAKDSLCFFKIIQVEMSLIPLYEDNMLYREMIDFFEKKGFILFSLENGFSNPKNGRLLQVDGIFVNLKTLKSLTS